MGFDFNKIVTVLADEDNIKRGEIALHALQKCAEHVLHRSHEAALLLDGMRGGKLSTPMGAVGVLFPKIPMILEQANRELFCTAVSESKPADEETLRLLHSGVLPGGQKSPYLFIKNKVKELNSHVKLNVFSPTVLEESLLGRGYQPHIIYHNDDKFSFWLNDMEGDLDPILIRKVH